MSMHCVSYYMGAHRVIAHGETRNKRHTGAKCAQTWAGWLRHHNDILKVRLFLNAELLANRFYFRMRIASIADIRRKNNQETEF